MQILNNQSNQAFNFDLLDAAHPSANYGGVKCNMSIEDIERTLPNGLHDAIMLKHVVDYEKQTLEFYINVWVGDLDSSIEVERERYKEGVLKFEGLEYFVIEPPGEVKLLFEPFSFSAGNPEVDKIKPVVILPESPEGTFKAFFFIYKLEAFMHICASKVEFKYGT